MIERDEAQIGKILSDLLTRQRPKSGRADCPDEEMLASYLIGVLTEVARAELEAHLSDCAICLDDLSAAYKTAQENERGTVSQRALERAMALVLPARGEPDFLELVVRLVKDSIELVTTSGQLASATAPAEIRGKGKSPDGGILQVEKELEKFRITVEVERTEAELCQVAVKVKPKAGSVADGIRLSLVCEGREQASYLARQGGAIFDRIPPGEYRLAVSQAGRPVGSMRLTIKEGRHER